LAVALTMAVVMGLAGPGVARGDSAPTPLAAGDPVIAAAGDIACSPTDPNFNGGDGVPGLCHMKATSDLILGMNPGNVLMLGDAQYNSGRLADFTASYDPSWGRVKGITHPTVGNHEYGTSGAGGYFSYFGDAATPRQPGCRQNCEGYYSFDVATWYWPPTRTPARW